SSDSPYPGGGGASALTGALGAALGMMVTNLTVGKKKYADVEDEIVDIRSKLEIFRNRLVELTDEDARAFEPLSKAYGLPKETQDQIAYKAQVMEEALYTASVVPLEIMKTIYEVMKLLEVLGEKGSRLALSDVGVGILFADAALEGASLNIFINTKMMTNTERKNELNSKANSLISDGKFLKEKVYNSVKSELK
ncbi:MAG: cyclodeaminase/cyclohydrolase family protein, partial [Suipraeoptans sp.]